MLLDFLNFILTSFSRIFDVFKNIELFSGFSFFDLIVGSVFCDVVIKLIDFIHYSGDGDS